MNHPKTLFVDACILVTAANSPEGGSARLLQLAGEKKVRLAATSQVLQEARKNIVKLFGKPLWTWFLRTISSTALLLTEDPTCEEEAAWNKITHAKDAHALAGAIKAKADILISLDRRHIVKPSVQKAFPIPILSSGEFLQRHGLSEPNLKNR